MVFAIATISPRVSSSGLSSAEFRQETPVNYAAPIQNGGGGSAGRRPSRVASAGAWQPTLLSDRVGRSRLRQTTGIGAPQSSRSADTFEPRLFNYRFLAHAVWSTDDFHLQLIENDIAGWSAEAQVIAVFHTNAGHVTLNDDAYNAERNIATGNPYKGLVADLMKRGVQIELCGATAKVHNWGSADLLPGLNVNTDAMARTVQLVREGFVKITE
jgi:intracellular sulfur oxidation DsrE/DsrF family protein